MEDGLKQRIYENILRFLENYRYIKSTAEATIPNFIAFCISCHWILTYKQSISHIVHLFKAADGWRALKKAPFNCHTAAKRGLHRTITSIVVELRFISTVVVTKLSFARRGD